MSKVREVRWNASLDKLHADMAARRRAHRWTMMGMVLLGLGLISAAVYLLLLWHAAATRGEALLGARWPGLAVVPGSAMAWLVFGGMAAVSVAFIVWGVRDLWSGDEKARDEFSPFDEEGWPAVYAGYLAETEEKERKSGAGGRVRPTCLPVAPPPVQDPLAMSVEGLTTQELRRILGALLVNAREARELIKRAQGHLSVEDYGEDLARAHLLMGLSVLCLLDLIQRTDPGYQTGEKSQTAEGGV